MASPQGAAQPEFLEVDAYATIRAMSAKKKIRTARSLRRRETGIEHRVWEALRGRRIAGLKFRRQHPIGPYVADFACPEAKLVIEIDGHWHASRQAQDNFRTDRLRSLGYEVARFETGEDIDLLAESIVFAVKRRLADLRRR